MIAVAGGVKTVVWLSKSADGTLVKGELTAEPPPGGDWIRALSALSVRSGLIFVRIIRMESTK